MKINVLLAALAAAALLPAYAAAQDTARVETAPARAASPQTTMDGTKATKKQHAKQAKSHNKQSAKVKKQKKQKAA